MKQTHDTTDTNDMMSTESMDSPTLLDLAETATPAERDEVLARWRERDLERAEQLRYQAAEIVDAARKNLADVEAEAEKLVATADRLDPPATEAAPRPRARAVVSAETASKRKPAHKTAKKRDAKAKKPAKERSAKASPTVTLEQILAALPTAKQEPVPSAQLAEKLGADITRVRVLLARGISDGLVEQQGEKRASKYRRAAK